LQSVYGFGFGALTLLVGWQEGHPVCKNRVVGCWRGYLSGARCRLAYGPADATATDYLLLQYNPDWFYLLHHVPVTKTLSVNNNVNIILVHTCA